MLFRAAAKAPEHHGMDESQIKKSNTTWIYEFQPDWKSMTCNNHAFSACMLPSGNLLHSYWKWPFIVDLTIKNGGSFHSFLYVYQRVSGKQTWCTTEFRFHMVFIIPMWFLRASQFSISATHVHIKYIPPLKKTSRLLSMWGWVKTLYPWWTST